jgi:hypothetical protein
MAKYWNCGELPWPDIEEFVDQNVGEAMKYYIEDDGGLMISWYDEPEPSVVFTADDFQKKESLYELLVYEVGSLRPGGDDAGDLFYDPEGDRRAILMQELLRTYLKWKEGGVHQPSKDEAPSDE